MREAETEFVPESFSEAARAVIYTQIRSRRDLRRFRPEPVPNDVLRRILEMAHLAPSVGFMQPWNFILIRSTDLRQRVKSTFEEINAREAVKIDDPRRRELYSTLKLEGILEAPLNVAVTCDSRRDAPFVLGRAPMPRTDSFSTCLAIQNLWLAARAEGVGVGWVSIIDRQSVETMLELPSGVELIAYLCVGYPIEFRPVPMLEEAGWKHREPLENLIFEDRWGVRWNAECGMRNAE
jgi:5,6-dimethylbenzimidazole synthase